LQSTLKSIAIAVTMPEFACWTKLTFPQCRTIENASSQDGKKWRLASNISKSSWPGYRGQCYGRVLESPETVWHITGKRSQSGLFPSTLIMLGWNSIDSLESYENSIDRTLQREAQAEFSSSTLKSHRCEVGTNSWFNRANHLGLIDVFFPSNIT